MQKVKKLLSLMLIMCMLFSFFVVDVHADTCCYIGITDIRQSQADDKLYIDFYDISYLPGRSISVSLEHVYTVNGEERTETVYSDYGIIVPEDVSSSTIDVDGSNFIKGEQYRVAMYYSDYCDYCYDNCWIQREFIAEDVGAYAYNVSDSYTETITVDTKGASLKVKPKQTGIYEMVVDSEDAWCLDIRNDSATFLNEGMYFVKENEEFYFKVKIPDYYHDTITSCDAKFKFAPVTVENINSLTTLPSSGDTVYNFNKKEGVFKLSIPKKGVYEVKIPETEYVNASIYNMDGEYISNIDGSAPRKCYFKADDYYYIPGYWGYKPESFLTTIKYTEPETLQFDTEISCDSYNDCFMYFELDKPSVVWMEQTNGYMWANVYGDTENYDIASAPYMIPAGKYYMVYGNEGSTAVFKKAEIPRVTAGEEIIGFKDYYDTNHIIIDIPKTAEYELYFSQGHYINDEWISGYAYVTLNEGEQKYFSYNGTFTLKEYVAEHTAVSLDQTVPVIAEQYKRNSFKFTAPEKDKYILTLRNEYGNNAYLGQFKVYTNDKVFYNKTDVYEDQYIVELDANETVYIEIGKCDANFDMLIKQKEKPLAITDTTVIDCSNDTYDYMKREIVFTPEEAGYYDFTAKKVSGDYYISVGIIVNGEELDTICSYRESTSKFVYASADEPLNMEIVKGTNQICEVEFAFEKAQLKEVDADNFEITDNSAYAVTIPETGIYALSASANINSFDEYLWLNPIVGSAERPFYTPETTNGEKIQQYIYAKAGEQIVIKEKFENYPVKVSIKKENATNISLNTKVSANTDKLYKLEVEADKLYKLDSTSTNATAVVYSDGNWNYMLNGENVFRTNSTDCYIFSEMSWYKDYEGIYMPKAEFKVSEHSSAVTETKINIENLYVTDLGKAKIYGSVELPYGADYVKLDVNFENVDEYIYSDYETYIDMLSSEKAYYNIEKYSYDYKFQVGKTYSITPILTIYYKDNTEAEIVGETKSYTAKAYHIDCKTLTDYDTYIDVRYTSNYEPPVFKCLEFTPSESGYTTITFPEYSSFTGIANENDMNTVYPFNGDGSLGYGDGTVTCTRWFEEGVKYYLYFDFHFEANAKISVSTMPFVSDDIVYIKGNITPDGVSYKIAGDIPTGAKLYAQLFNAQGIKEFKMIPNPLAESTITFNNMTSSDNCRLYLWKSNLKPVCDSVLCQ